MTLRHELPRDASASSSLDVELAVGDGELLRGRRPERCGQDDAAARARRAAPGRRRTHRHRRRDRRRRGRRRVRAAGTSIRRCRVPGLPPVPAPDRARQRRIRLARARGCRSATLAPAPRSTWRASTSRAAKMRSRPSCRADRHNASRSRAHWRSSPRCCCSTSRSPRSTCSTASRSAGSSASQLASFPGARVLVTHDPVDALVARGPAVHLAGRPHRAGGDTLGDHCEAAFAVRRRARRRESLSRRRAPKRCRGRRRHRNHGCGHARRRRPGRGRAAAPSSCTGARPRAARATPGRGGSRGSSGSAIVCACMSWAAWRSSPR